ncbi:MAG: TonB family protein [Bryobacteraceae bacterium]
MENVDMHAAYWLGNLAAWSAQSAILIAAAGAALWLLRLRVPRVRLAYWQAVLAICLLLPAVQPWRQAADGQVEVSMGPPRVVTAARTAGPSLPWREWLLLTLAGGCLARAAWLAAGLGKLRRWRRASQPMAPLPLHLDRIRTALAPRAEFVVAAAVPGPVTFGLRRPLVVLPEGFAALPETSQEAIACHELLHVRRHDWLVTVGEEAIGALLWFHPAVWWVTGQIQLAREQTVDGEVVRFTKGRREYLDALLAMAGDRAALDLAPATLFSRKRHLKKRVALLLEEVTMSKRTLISFCAASSGVLLAAGWLALHTFPLQAAPQEDSAKLLHSVPPKYPPAAREKHIEGDVVLEVQIDAEGHVSDAHVLSGPQELRSSALEAILQWHYSPKAMSLPATTQVTMTFKLPKDGAPSTMIPAPPPIGQPFTLKAIRIDGLSDSARDELLQRLPVHIGDTVDQDVMRSVAKTARDFDDHLMAAAGKNGNIHIFIMPPAPPPGDGVRIRVGGNMQQAKLARKVQPVYPPEAKAARIEGIVRLEATIGKDGSVENLVLLSGHPLLAPAAMEAVRQWQYQTTLLNGNPVEVVTEIQVNFTLSQ